MAEISTNYAPQISTSRPTSVSKKRVAGQTTPLRKYWKAEKRKNSGLIEKLYNKIKNLTGMGVGSKAVEKTITMAEQGQISTEKAVNKINTYTKSQETSAQLLGDGVSIATAGATFFGMNKALKYANAFLGVNKPIVDMLDKEIKEGEAKLKESKSSAKTKKWTQFAIDTYKETIKTFKSNKRLSIITVGLAALIGGDMKYWTMKLNRTCSDEFKVDKSVYGSNKKSAAYRAEKKRLNKERKNANLKNRISGTINGLMMPVMALGGVIGAPIYLAVNSINRYFIAGKSKNKSVSDYLEGFNNDKLTAGLVTAALAVPLVKKGNFTKAFNENIQKSVEKLSKSELKKPDFNTKSAYQQLEDIMLTSPGVKSIIEGHEKTNKKITKLTEENIFAVKFQQIAGAGGEGFMEQFKELLGSGDKSAKIKDIITNLMKEMTGIGAKQKKLTLALQEDCPPTRTKRQAQKFINKAMGEKKYKVTKLLGVGTVAETYMAKGPDGKEVCIKILKDGISKEKILKDKEKFVDMVKNLPNKSEEEKDYLLRNIEDLADGIIKEVDLKNEMEAAQKLAKSTHVANVVKPIEVKNNVYVMEKATGVSLKSYLDLNWLSVKREGVQRSDFLIKMLGKNKDGEQSITDSFKFKFIKRMFTRYFDKKIKKVVDKMPGLEKVKFDKNDTSYLLQEYQKVFIEQFHKVDRNGKTIHADVHPGNIFINPEALRTRKGKLFTLIDTGNTIDMNIEQSMHALNLASYVKKGNVKDIAEYVLTGAKLPAGMTYEEALKKITEELNKCFFDDKIKIDMMNADKVLGMTDSIMQKYNIIPSSTQMNLNKSKTAAKNALNGLRNSLTAFEGIENTLQEDATKMSAGFGLTKTGAKWFKSGKQYDGMVALQERNNLKQMTPAQILKQKLNPNAPKESSEDYITYKLKQVMWGKDFKGEA